MVRLNAVNLGINVLIVFLSALPYASYFTLMPGVSVVTDLSQAPAKN